MIEIEFKNGSYIKAIEAVELVRSSRSYNVTKNIEDIISVLISWLNDQKYINVDETSDDMTEEFEREHQWELSRNCFINKTIRKLEEIK